MASRKLGSTKIWQRNDGYFFTKLYRLNYTIQGKTLYIYIEDYKYFIDMCDFSLYELACSHRWR